MSYTPRPSTFNSKDAVVAFDQVFVNQESELFDSIRPDADHIGLVSTDDQCLNSEVK